MPINKRPLYYTATRERESAFYESTPKHVLYALLRDYAAQIHPDGVDDALGSGKWLEMTTRRIETLRLNGLIA